VHLPPVPLATMAANPSWVLLVMMAVPCLGLAMRMAPLLDGKGQPL